MSHIALIVDRHELFGVGVNSQLEAVAILREAEERSASWSEPLHAVGDPLAVTRRAADPM